MELLSKEIMSRHSYNRFVNYCITTVQSALLTKRHLYRNVIFSRRIKILEKEQYYSNIIAPAVKFCF